MWKFHAEQVVNRAMKGRAGNLASNPGLLKIIALKKQYSQKGL